jgi:hypothetical protein
MVVFPTPTLVTVLPLTVATLVLELVYEMGRPELAVALNVKGATPGLWLGIAPKLIVWEAWPTVRVWLALGAAV